LRAARFPIAIDRFPTVSLPTAILDEELIALGSATRVAIVEDETLPHRAGDTHARAGHVLDDAVVQGIVLPVQHHRRALRKIRRVPEDKTAHFDVVNPLFGFEFAHTKDLRA